MLLLWMMPYLIESGHLGKGALRSEYFCYQILIRSYYYFPFSHKFDLLKRLQVHDYYKCNDINHEKFYKCQFVRDPNSKAAVSGCLHSWFMVIPAFKLIFDPGARLF